MYIAPLPALYQHLVIAIEPPGGYDTFEKRLLGTYHLGGFGVASHIWQQEQVHLRTWVSVCSEGKTN